MTQICTLHTHKLRRGTVQVRHTKTQDEYKTVIGHNYLFPSVNFKRGWVPVLTLPDLGELEHAAEIVLAKSVPSGIIKRGGSVWSVYVSRVLLCLAPFLVLSVCRSCRPFAFTHAQ